MAMNILGFLIFSIAAYWLFSSSQKFNLTRKIYLKSEINSTGKTDQVLNETYMKQLLGIGQITRKNGNLIVKILRNHLDETSCPQSDTNFKLLDNDEILSLLRIYKKMIQYYYDISNESKNSIAILRNSSSELRNKLDDLMKNSPKSICKIEYNKYTVNKNSNYRRFLRIFKYVSFIQFDISTSVDILQSREYFQNYQEARDKGKKYISRSLAILGRINKKQDLTKKNLNDINKEELLNIEKEENLASTDQVIYTTNYIYSIFLNLENHAKKYKELIDCYFQNNEIGNFNELVKSIEEIFVEKPDQLMAKLQYIYNDFRKEMFFENFQDEIPKIKKEIDERYNALKAKSCRPASSNIHLINDSEKKRIFIDILFKNSQSIRFILHKEIDFLSKMKSVVYTNSLNISNEIELLKAYTGMIDLYQYNCSDCIGTVKNPKHFNQFLQYIRLYGQKRQIIDILQELISIVNSNYDKISNCYINEKSNITYYVNEIKKVATNFNLVFDVSITIEIAEKCNEEALISLKNVKSAANNCQKGNRILTNNEKKVNQAIQSIIHESIVFFDKTLSYFNDNCRVFDEEGFNDLLRKFGTAFENLNTDANDVTKLTDFELKNTLDKIKRFAEEIVEEDATRLELDKKETNINEKYKNRLTSFINDFQKLNETVVCGVSEGGTHEITINVNVSKLIGKVISLFDCYLEAFLGNKIEYEKLFNNDEWSGDDIPTAANCNPKPEVAKDTNVLIVSILKNIFIILRDSTPVSHKEMIPFYTYFEKTKLNMQSLQRLFQLFKFFQNNDNLARVKQSLLLIWKDFKQLELDVHMKEEKIEINMEEEINFEETTTSQSP